MFNKDSMLKYLIFTFSIMFCFFSSLSAQVNTKAKRLFDLSIEELMNVEVSIATKQDISQNAAPAIVSVITEEEILSMGARNIMDILMTLPGFDINHSIITHQDRAVVRGVSPIVGNNKLKFMINNHYMSAQFGTIHTHVLSLPIAAIKQVEIIRGPGSALYGTGAFSGVINIITKHGGEEPSGINVEGGSFNTIKTSARFSRNKNDKRVYLYADYMFTDGYEGIIDSDLFGSGLQSAAPGNLTAGMQYYTLHSNININDFYFSGFAQRMSPANPIGIARALTDEHRSNYGMYFGEIGYKYIVKNKGNLSFKTYYDYGVQDSKLELFSEETMEHVFGWKNGESAFGRPVADNVIFGGEVNSNYEVRPGIQMAAGISYEHRKTLNVVSYTNANITGRPLTVNGVTYDPFEYLGGMTDISENGNWLIGTGREIYALFGQGITDLKKLFNLKNNVQNLTLTAGVRYDRYSDTGSTVNPRLGFVYSPDNRLYLKVLYGSAFRAPQVKELYSTNNPAKLGNPDLGPEKINTFEGQAGYNFSDNFTGNMTYFDTETSDIIQGVGMTVENVETMKVSGVETEFKAGFGNLKYAFLNFTWLNLVNTTGKTILSGNGQVYTHGDINPGSISTFTANLGLNYKISPLINTSIYINYAGEKKRSEEMVWNGEILKLKDPREPLKSCLLLNASVTFRNILQGTDVQLSGYNLLNSDHRDPDPEGIILNDLPKENRNFMLRVFYSF